MPNKDDSRANPLLILYGIGWLVFAALVRRPSREGEPVATGLPQGWIEVSPTILRTSSMASLFAWMLFLILFLGLARFLLRRETRVPGAVVTIVGCVIVSLGFAHAFGRGGDTDRLLSGGAMGLKMAVVFFALSTACAALMRWVGKTRPFGT